MVIVMKFKLSMHGKVQINENTTVSTKENDTVFAYISRKESKKKVFEEYGTTYDFHKLGNPFKMYKESKRNSVCDMYNKWFDEQIKIKTNVVRNEFVRLWKLYLECVKENKPLVLICFCAPKRCHGDKLKLMLNECELAYKAK